jgi:hypothetical protein
MRQVSIKKVGDAQISNKFLNTGTWRSKSNYNKIILMAFLHLNKTFTSGLLLIKTWDNFGEVKNQPVCIANRYRMNGQGNRFLVGARFFAHVQTGPGGLPSFLYNGYRVFLGGLSRRDVELTAHTI